MAELDFYIDIESAGVRLGAGPLTSAAAWESKASLDRAGRFHFTLPAEDPKAVEVQKRRIVRAWALVGGVWTEVGAGIIDSIVRSVQDDGTVLLSVSGDDLLRELTFRSVRDLKLYFGNAPVSHATAVAAVAGYAPPGWTFTPDGSPPNNLVYGRFNGDTVLAGVIKVAEKSLNHFYRGSGRTVVFASDFAASGVRAIQATGDLVAETCAITNLTVNEETWDLITRIIPRATGNGDLILGLRSTTRVAPSGYVLDAEDNSIEHSAATAEYGLCERVVDFKEIGPISNTSADIRAASNALYDAALELLRRRKEPYISYTLALAGCSALLRPMQTLRVVYRDIEAGLDIDADLNILEATWRVDTDGVQTTAVVVSTAQRWAESDAGAIVDSIQQGQTYMALPQTGPNSYVTAYRGNVDHEESAAFRFRFGNEVTQLQQVLFEFQLLPFESTVRSVAVQSMTGGSGELITDDGGAGDSGTPSNDTSGTPSNNTSSTPSTNATSVPSSNTSGAPSTNTSSTPSASNSGVPSSNTSGSPSTNTSSTPSTNISGTASGNTGSSSGNTGTAAGNTGTASGNTGAASGNTGGSGDLTSGPAEGGDIDGDGEHTHYLTAVGDSFAGTMHALYIDVLGVGNNRLVALGMAGAEAFEEDTITRQADHTHEVGDHTHDLSSHDHSLNSHTHSLNSHDHSLNSHAHSLNSHTHDLNNHSHDLASHTHNLGNHTHDLSSHTHDLASHTHNLGNHTHDLASHTHTMNNHTHGLSSHTHSLSNHQHTLTPDIETVFGIYRAPAVRTWALAQLEYRVNGGAWAGLESAEAAGDDWWRIDITAEVQDLATFRPLQESNLLEVRASPSTDLMINLGTAPEVGLYEFVTWNGDVFVDHGLSVGAVIEVTGTDAHDSIYTVVDVPSSIELIVESVVPGTEHGGTISVQHLATIDAQLSVRNTIQAILYA